MNDVKFLSTYACTYELSLATCSQFLKILLMHDCIIIATVLINNQLHCKNKVLNGSTCSLQNLQISKCYEDNKEDK